MSSPLKIIPETQPEYLSQSPSSPTLSEASTYMSSPPKAQPQYLSQYLSQSRSQSPTMEEVVAMETEVQRGNRDF